MATTVMVGGALLGAYSANRNAKASNKASGGKTDSTTTQDPYLSDWYAPDINAVLNYQRGVAARGVPQLGPNGQITYQDQLPWGNEGGDARFAAGNAPAGGGGGPAVPAGGSRRPDGRIVDASGKTIYTPTASASGGGGKGKGKGGAGSGNATGATGAGAPTVAPSINYQDPKSVFGAVARAGLNAGNTQTQQQARTATGNILGAAGGGGPEDTGFEGYNPVLNRLTGRLESNADQANARNLLMGFIGENNRAGGAAGGNGSPTGGNTGSGGRGATVSYGTPGSRAESRQAYQSLVSGGGTGGMAGGVPDTMKTQSYFGDETRKIMDEQANEAELSSLIASMNEDVEKGMYRDLAQLDAASQRSGRFGGDMWKGMNTDAREEALQEMTKTASGVRVGDRESRRQARLAALAGVNQRDQALLGANVQREGIAANERSSSAASSAAYGAQADQLALAKRGQDLQAISQLMGNEEFNLGQLGQVGGQLSSDRIGTLGLVPGLEGIGLQGLQTALGAGGGLTDLRGQNVQQSIANANNRLQQQGLNQQSAMWNAGQQQSMINNYLGTLVNIGSMGGSQRTVGTNAPQGGFSPSGAAIQGALGGGLAAYGAYQQYRQ